MEEGDGGQVEFGSVPGEGRAGQTECIFLLSFFFSFCLADMGRRRSGSPGTTLMSLGTGFGLCV